MVVDDLHVSPERLEFIVFNESFFNVLWERDVGILRGVLKQGCGDASCSVFRLHSEARVRLRGEKLSKQNQREKGEEKKRDGEDAALKKGELRPQTPK